MMIWALFLPLFLCSFISSENADPNLTFTFHVTRYSLTSSLYLTACDETGFEGFDTEGTEGQFVAAEGVTFDFTLLLLSISCFLRL